MFFIVYFNFNFVRVVIALLLKTKRKELNESNLLKNTYSLIYYFSYR